ncbi:type III secretion system stalk subunit SctO [Bordetella bronchialis]|uniref:Type III secretion protein n=1 Tax=Bordetella bronchialis TaxID=463025 RepID=A0A193G0A0_9BORD|nr:YscO family type III secretion system apparatus protein [Bordetella bronchialis]ANN73432.1 hypothetical protein BAU08_20630 [Bordetella bronchialis]
MTGRGGHLRRNLVALRALRESRAERALVRLHRDRDDAQVYLEREQRQLDLWRCRADEEQATLYAALLAEAVDRRSLERTLAKIDGLRQRTRALQRGVESAREKREQAQAALDHGRALRAAAAKATRKSTEVLDVYRRQCALAEERIAEDALDETAVLMHGRGAP